MKELGRIFGGGTLTINHLQHKASGRPTFIIASMFHHGVNQTH